MAGPTISGHVESYRYFDNLNSGKNPIAPYQLVSLMTAAQIAAQAGAAEGEACRPAVVGGTTVLERILGVTEYGAKHAQQIGVRNEGIAHVMVGAAVAYGALLQCGQVSQVANDAAPLINLYELNLPVEPGVGVTYNLSMADDVAVTATTGAGTNSLILPVGYALDSATAAYQIVRVKLFNAPFYA